MVELVYSVNGVPIRLTDERWAHITNNQPYIAAYFESVLDAIERPTWIFQGRLLSDAAAQRIMMLNLCTEDL